MIEALVRPMSASDVDDAASILRDAFDAIYKARGHTPPFPSLDSAVWLCRAYLELDPGGCVVADRAGRMAGVGFLHPRGAVASIGPVAARPGAGAGVGRVLMRRLLELSGSCGSVRLFQDSFNPDSFGLYLRLGFEVRDVAPYLVAERMAAPLAEPAGIEPIGAADLPSIARYDRERTGGDRSCDLALLAQSGSAFLHRARRVRDEPTEVDGFLFYRVLPNRVVLGPAVADAPDTMCALLDAVGAALTGQPAVIRASAHSPEVIRRAFSLGFRIDHLGNLMVRGGFSAPAAQLYPLFPESL